MGIVLAEDSRRGRFQTARQTRQGIADRIQKNNHRQGLSLHVPAVSNRPRTLHAKEQITERVNREKTGLSNIYRPQLHDPRGRVGVRRNTLHAVRVLAGACRPLAVRWLACASDCCNRVGDRPNSLWAVWASSAHRDALGPPGPVQRAEARGETGGTAEDEARGNSGHGDTGGSEITWANTPPFLGATQLLTRGRDAQKFPQRAIFAMPKPTLSGTATANGVRTPYAELLPIRTGSSRESGMRWQKRKVFGSAYSAAAGAT